MTFRKWKCCVAVTSAPAANCDSSPAAAPSPKTTQSLACTSAQRPARSVSLTAFRHAQEDSGKKSAMNTPCSAGGPSRHTLSAWPASAGWCWSPGRRPCCWGRPGCWFPKESHTHFQFDWWPLQFNGLLMSALKHFIKTCVWCHFFASYLSIPPDFWYSYTSLSPLAPFCLGKQISA